MPQVVIRHYSVIIKPDEHTEYDPIRVTLSYPLADAEALDPTSEAAVKEAFRRAVALERKENGTPAGLAARLAALPDLVAAPDIVLTARRTGKPVIEIARTHFSVENAFHLGALIGAARGINVNDYFDGLALDRAVDAIASAHRNLTAEVSAQDLPAKEAMTAWTGKRGADIDRIKGAIDSIVSSGLTLSKVTVASSLLGDLVKD